MWNLWKPLLALIQFDKSGFAKPIKTQYVSVPEDVFDALSKLEKQGTIDSIDMVTPRRSLSFSEVRRSVSKYNGCDPKPQNNIDGLTSLIYSISTSFHIWYHLLYVIFTTDNKHTLLTGDIFRTTIKNKASNSLGWCYEASHQPNDPPFRHGARRTEAAVFRPGAGNCSWEKP